MFFLSFLSFLCFLSFLSSLFRPYFTMMVFISSEPRMEFIS